MATLAERVRARRTETLLLLGLAIAAICEAFANRGQETLMALEHFDDAYVRAIGYKVKAPRQDLPKAVLLVDMVGHDGSQIEPIGGGITPLARVCRVVVAEK